MCCCSVAVVGFVVGVVGVTLVFGVADVIVTIVVVVAVFVVVVVVHAGDFDVVAGAGDAHLTSVPCTFVCSPIFFA